MEIGDNIEVEEESNESSTRSPTATGTRRKNRSGKGRNGKRNGNGGGEGEDDGQVAPRGAGGSIRENDLRRLLAAMRDLKEGDFNVRLPVCVMLFEVPMAGVSNGSEVRKPV